MNAWTRAEQGLGERPTDTLHVGSHGQLTVKVDPKGADVGLLKSNIIFSELNINHADFQELLSTTQLDKLSFVRVRFQTVSCNHESFFQCKLKFSDQSVGLSGLVELIDLPSLA